MRRTRSSAHCRCTMSPSLQNSVSYAHGMAMDCRLCTPSLASAGTSAGGPVLAWHHSISSRDQIQRILLVPVFKIIQVVPRAKEWIPGWQGFKYYLGRAM